MRKIETILREMDKKDKAGNYADSEIVCDGRECWLGMQKVSHKAVDELLCLMAIKDTNDGGKCQRYVINDIGRALIVNPAIAHEIGVAIKSGVSFTIKNNRIEAI